MTPCLHADAGFLNEANLRSCAGTHIFLLEDDPFPRFNGADVYIAHIIKFGMLLLPNPNLLHFSSWR